MQRREFIILLGGAAAAWPISVRAQQPTLPVIGFVNVASAKGYAPQLSAFLKGLSETGYVDGRNVAIEYRWAEGHFDRLPQMAADLVGRKVEVIAATGGPPAAFAAKNATSTIPIVFVTGTDPVTTGLVAALARPGGNLTGVSLLYTDLTAKRLELLAELAPGASVIALLVNPNSSEADPAIRNATVAARTKRVELQILRAGSESEIDAAFATLEQARAGALVVGSDPFFSTRREQIVTLAARHAMPTIYYGRQFPASGGLISYGTDTAIAWRHAGVYTGRILKGAKPADLPVQQPTTFELVINLKTATALGLTVPQAILTRADEVIE
jgi:putative ABC transport system substrate-binding protein